MLKRSILQVTFCGFITLISLAKETYPLAKPYLKNYACEIGIVTVFENVIPKELSSLITENEKQELIKLKEHYCNSIIKTY